jgi:preprotein translocase subunit YajC
MIGLYGLLAQATQSSGATGPTGPGGSLPPPSGTDVFLRQFLPIILIVAVFMWWMSRGKNKERQRYEQMLNSLQKNDRVQTIGGILGTVVDVRDNEVVLKVDETSNVKMRFNRTAIKEVLRDAPTTTK